MIATVSVLAISIFSAKYCADVPMWMRSELQEGQNTSRKFGPSPVPWQVAIGLKQESSNKGIVIV